MSKSTVKPGASATAKARGTSLALLKPEQARENLHLLLLANPNYFGNLPDSPFKPILNIVADSVYETLGCVGYSAPLSRLEAVVSISVAPRGMVAMRWRAALKSPVL